MHTRIALPTPSHYQSAHAFDMGYRPKVLKLPNAARDWAQAHGITAAANDRFRIALLLIDLQNDFCFPDGTLFVGGRSGKGAMEDNDRLCQFIYRNLGVITEITPTLDTHVPFQVFSRSSWLTENDTLIGPFTDIATADIASGKVRVNPLCVEAVTGDKGAYTWLSKQWEHYAHELERQGKYTLKVWTEHCMLGDIGHALAGVVHEARMFHAYTRGRQNTPEIKGGNPLTEHYSIFRPEVSTRWDGKGAVGQKNTTLFKTLLSYDAVIAAGQAGSHCFASSVDDFLNEIVTQDPTLARKTYLLRDCMSPVTVPDGKGGFFADYTADQEAALAKFESAGMHVVDSTTPIDQWNGIRLAA